MSAPVSLLNWTPAPRALAARLEGIHLFLVDLDIFQPSSLDALSAAERQRGARFHFAEDRKHFFAARVALREILAHLLESQPGLLLFATGSHGKPELTGPHAGALHFNLSHSAGHMLLAVSALAPLGVDLEEVRSEVEMEPLAEHYFSPEELWKFRTARGQERVWTFFETWTAIEARLKAEECGLSDEPLPQLAQRWHTFSLRIAARFAATVATGELHPFYAYLDMAELTAPKHLIVIEPSRGLLKINWRELWDYRDLLVVLVQRDFISRYKQTILGPAWFLVQPLLNTLVFTIIFSHIAKIGTDQIPPPLFFLCGQLAWNYFTQNITAGSGTFLNNSHILDKVYFPRLILPTSAIVANLVSFGLQTIPFVLFYAFYKISGNDHGMLHISWAALLIIPLVLEIALFSLGVSLWMAAISAKYRDIVHLNQYLIQIWMYGSAVIFPLSAVPKSLTWLAALNPMAGIVESFRMVLLGRGSLQSHEMLIGLAVTFFVLITGIMLFQRVERTVADNI